MLVAEIIGVEPGPQPPGAPVINKGGQDGVLQGQAVLESQGLIEQAADSRAADPARVLLICRQPATP